MLSRAHARLTFANVVSCLALFVALGGTGYAVTQIDANSVGTKQLKKNAVVSKKVKNGSLLSKDFKAGQLPAGPTGPAGATGLSGAKGDKGDACLPTIPECVGPKGDNGDTGPAGPYPTGNLPSGITLKGVYRIGSQGTTSGIAQTGISFPFALSAEPTPHLIEVGSPSTADCPGSAASPAAAAGHLCVYEVFASAAIASKSIGNPVTNTAPGASRYGFTLNEQHGVAANPTNFSWVGTWAVTAP